MKRRHIAALALAGAGLIFGAVPLVNRGLHNSRQEAVWGTVDNPAFRINHEMGQAITYNQYINKEMEYLKKRPDHFSRIKTGGVEKRLDEFNDYFQSHPLTEEQHNRIKRSYELFFFYVMILKKT